MVRSEATPTAPLAEYNQQLSEARAKAVRDYFIKQASRTSGSGPRVSARTNPVASNDTVEGRARTAAWSCTRHVMNQLQ